MIRDDGNVTLICVLLLSTYQIIYMLWVRNSIRARCTILCDKVCQGLATGRWFSPRPPVSSTNKTDHHDITEILLKVALSIIKQTNINIPVRFIFTSSCLWEGACLIYVICVCLCIVVSRTYCVVLCFSFSSSCVRHVHSFSGMSPFFITPSVFSNVYLFY